MNELREALRQAHNHDIALEAREIFCAFASGLNFLSKPTFLPMRSDWTRCYLAMAQFRFPHRYEWLGD